MTTDYRIVIPARAASQRLPGKPLLDVCGQPLLQRVWACATRSGASQVVIATDDEQIFSVATAFGAQVLITGDHHKSGSDRIAECIDRLEWSDETVVVNLQGDEPQMPPECLDQVAGLLGDAPEAQAASLYQPIDDPAEIRDHNAVKVVTDVQGRALYFSRSVVPANRQWNSIEDALANGCVWNRHIGLYAYRAGALKQFTQQEPTPLEQEERLEQLRILETGGVILLAQAVQRVPGGVDTAQDLERVRQTFQ